MSDTVSTHSSNIFRKHVKNDIPHPQENPRWRVEGVVLFLKWFPWPQS